MKTEYWVYIVDDDDAVRDSIGLAIETAGFCCEEFESAEQFLESYQPGKRACLLLDINMRGMTGLELQEALNIRNIHLPVIFLTAFGDIPTTVKAVKAGAIDFLTKPVSSKTLIERIQTVFRQEESLEEHIQNDSLNCLTPRELEVLPKILDGLSSKQIARELNISYRTVEIHRAHIMSKTGSQNLMELDRLWRSKLIQNQVKA